MKHLFKYLIGVWVIILSINLLAQNIPATWNAGCAGFFCFIIDRLINGHIPISSASESESSAPKDQQ